MRRASNQHSRRSRTLSAGIGLLFVLLTIMVGQPANAHDYVQSTTPAKGETVNRPLDTVAITFTKPPMSGLDGSSVIVVTSEDGRTVSSDEVTIEGVAISTAVSFAGQGIYTVTWRSVSSDGHPISDTYDFVWRSNGATSAPNPAPSAATSESSAPTAPAVDSAGDSAVAAVSPLLVVGCVVLILILLTIVIIAIYRPRKLREQNAPGEKE